MNVIRSLMVGLVAYVVAGDMLDALITGTATGDTIMTSIIPIAIAAGTVIASLGIGSLNSRSSGGA